MKLGFFDGLCIVLHEVCRVNSEGLQEGFLWP